MFMPFILVFITETDEIWIENKRCDYFPKAMLNILEDSVKVSSFLKNSHWPKRWWDERNITGRLLKGLCTDYPQILAPH